MAASSALEYIPTEFAAGVPCVLDAPGVPEVPGVPGVPEVPDAPEEAPDAPEEAPDGAPVPEASVGAAVPVSGVVSVLPCGVWERVFFCRARMESIFLRLLSTNSLAAA